MSEEPPRLVLRERIRAHGSALVEICKFWEIWVALCVFVLLFQDAITSALKGASVVSVVTQFWTTLVGLTDLPLVKWGMFVVIIVCVMRGVSRVSKAQAAAAESLLESQRADYQKFTAPLFALAKSHANIFTQSQLVSALTTLSGVKEGLKNMEGNFPPPHSKHTGPPAPAMAMSAIAAINSANALVVDPLPIPEIGNALSTWDDVTRFLVGLEASITKVAGVLDGLNRDIASAEINVRNACWAARIDTRVKAGDG